MRYRRRSLLTISVVMLTLGALLALALLDASPCSACLPALVLDLFWLPLVVWIGARQEHFPYAPEFLLDPSVSRAPPRSGC